MSENPFQSPQTTSTAVGVLSGTREDLRLVAKYQKGILICILLYLAAVIVSLVSPPEIRSIVGAGVLILGVVSAVFIFLLAMKVYGVGLGIVLGLLCFLPLINLLVLLMINGKATTVLKQNGIQVGLLGANTSAI